MPKEKVAFIQGMMKSLEQKRVTWEALWQDVADFIIPLREDIRGTAMPGTEFGSRIFDGTAVAASKLQADGFHGHLVSPATQWFGLEMEEDELNTSPDVNMWLQAASKSMYREFRRTSFYNEIWMYLYDGITIGTATMYIGDDAGADRILFETIHPGEAFIEENENGDVDTVFRKIVLTAKQAISKFGADAVPNITKELAKTDPFKPEKWLHAVYPRELYDSSSKLAKNKKYASVWFHCGEGKIVKESGYDDFPYACWRYNKTRRETYGRSPGMFALADIKGSNVVAKTMLNAAHLSVDPPKHVPAEFIGKVEWKPGGNLYYSNIARRIEPAFTGINFPVGKELQLELKRAVEQHFYVDFFLMLSRAERQMTAVEVMERMGEKASLIGATVGRLTSEALGKIIDRVFNIMIRQNKLPPLPSILSMRPGARISVNYLSPLAQAQKRLFESYGIKSGLQAAAPVFQLFPESMQLVDGIASARILLRSHGYPEEALNSDEFIQDKMAKMQQAKDMAAANEQMNLAAKSVKELSKYKPEAMDALEGKLSAAGL